jgi:hypothetical protein
MGAAQFSSNLDEFTIHSTDPAENTLHGHFLGIGVSGASNNQLSAESRLVILGKTNWEVSIETFEKCRGLIIDQLIEKAAPDWLSRGRNMLLTEMNSGGDLKPKEKLFLKQKILKHFSGNSSLTKFVRIIKKKIPQ